VAVSIDRLTARSALAGGVVVGDVVVGDVVVGDVVVDVAPLGGATHAPNTAANDRAPIVARTRFLVRRVLAMVAPLGVPPTDWIAQSPAARMA
jgi:hypothetical protein